MKHVQPAFPCIRIFNPPVQYIFSFYKVKDLASPYIRSKILIMAKFRATNVYFIATFATLGGMLFGFDISSISGVIGTQQYLDYFHNPDSTQQGGITAAMPGGSFCGALASGILSDKISRKYTIQLGAIIWCIGAILQCASQNIGMVCPFSMFLICSSSSVASLLA